MTTDGIAKASDLDGLVQTLPANRYCLNHMLEHVERCISAVDVWLAQRRANWTTALADNSNESIEMEEFNLPCLWLPASVGAFLPLAEARTAGNQPVERTDIAEMVEKARQELQQIDDTVENRKFLQEAESRLETAIRYLVTPYERLRLQIWTRLQQLDTLDLRDRSTIPGDLVPLPNALTIEQMIDQWFTADPESRIKSFTISGPLDLEVNLIDRIVRRKSYRDQSVRFASAHTAWMAFIISFLAGRNGADSRLAERLYDEATENWGDARYPTRNRGKAIREANKKLVPLEVHVSNWGLKDGKKPE